MNQSELSTLQHQVESIEIPATVRDSILRLIDEHGTQQRAESFWSVRAPALNDEVVHLRQIETSARALRAALATAAAPADSIAGALNELDSWRMNRSES
jgi:hypothetical protein